MGRDPMSRWDRHRDGTRDKTRDVMCQSQSQKPEPEARYPFLQLTTADKRLNALLNLRPRTRTSSKAIGSISPPHHHGGHP